MSGMNQTIGQDMRKWLEFEPFVQVPFCFRMHVEVFAGLEIEVLEIAAYKLVWMVVTNHFGSMEHVHQEVLGISICILPKLIRKLVELFKIGTHVAVQFSIKSGISGLQNASPEKVDQ
jgi:hypothetical protein